MRDTGFHTDTLTIYHVKHNSYLEKKLSSNAEMNNDSTNNRVIVTKAVHYILLKKKKSRE